MKFIARFDLLIAICFSVAVLQYAQTAVETALHPSSAILWQLSGAAQESAGPLRYIKDLWLMVVSFLWPVVIVRQVVTPSSKLIFSSYFLWLVVFVFIGSMGYLIWYTSLLFAQAGLRWLMLFHVTVGIFLLMRTLPGDSRRQQWLANVLLVIAVLDIMLVLRQLAAAGSAYGIGLGAARLTGFFNNAGVAGFLGLALALVSLQLDAVKYRVRYLLSGLGLFIALSSGSRSTMMAVFVVTALQVWEFGDQPGVRRFRSLRNAFFVPIFVTCSAMLYPLMIDAVDRGGILEQQLAGGGRIDTINRMIEVFRTAGFVESLFGRGLGIGTNTAYTLLLAHGIQPDSIRFNWLVDNAVITMFLQVGLVGSFVFWGGLALMIVVGKPVGAIKFKLRYWLAVLIFVFFLFVGNPFEHYLIMFPLGIAFGAPFWSARFKRDVAQRANVSTSAANFGG